MVDPGLFRRRGGRHLGSDSVASVDSSDATIWIAAWNSTNALDGTQSANNNILYVRSDDAGVTWNQPVFLNAGGAGDSQFSDQAVRVRSFGVEEWIAVWRRHSQNTPGEFVFSVSIDGGLSWNQGAEPIMHHIESLNGPSLDVDEAGNCVVVTRMRNAFAGNIGFDGDIVACRSADLGATWTMVHPVDPNAYLDAASDQRPVVAAGGLGHWLIAWQRAGIHNPTGPDTDLLVVKSTPGDCNANEINDADDIANGASTDLNLNGVPDECEPDCNGNGQIDDLDISAGKSLDCYGNGIPDECDIASGDWVDCNRDGVPDACQPDCDADGVMDFCDEIGFDCNGNGTPDACDLVVAGFALDDGDSDSTLSTNPALNPTIIANRFEAGLGQTIESVAVGLNQDDNQGLAIGDTITLCIWDDPNDDGLPDDAVLLLQQDVQVLVLSSTIENGVDTFNHFAIEPLKVNGSFFVGFAIGAYEQPATLDLDNYVPSTSWWVNGSQDPASIANAVEAAEICDLCTFTWLIRVNTNDVNNNGIPDDCEEKANPADIAPPGGDGVVNAADLAELLAQWGTCPPPEQGDCTADIAPPSGGGDGIVGPADLAELLANWTN